MDDDKSKDAILAAKKVTTHETKCDKNYCQNEFRESKANEKVEKTYLICYLVVFFCACFSFNSHFSLSFFFHLKNE